MKAKLVFILLLPAFMLNMDGQDKYFKQNFLEAEYFLMTEEYTPALRIYENLLSTDPDNANLNFLCGFCTLKTGGDIRRVILLFEKAAERADASYKEGSYKETNAPMDALFLLARSYHINNQFDRAIETYSEYREGIDKKDFAEVEYVNANIQACELGKAMIRHPIDVKFRPLGGNLEFDGQVRNPVVSGNDSVMVFITDQNNRINLMMTVKEEGRWSKALTINPQVGLSGNICPVSLSYDGTELFIVLNDYFNMDIFVSHRNGGRWSRAQKLNSTINTKYSETHAAISRDGSCLFFTSDRKGGIGGLDIYMARRMKGDEWGTPVNLGNPVNTFYNEESPFLANNDTRLFFSSQGHNTMGGYDIFYSNLNNKGSWEPPVNIGYPVNTTGDDLFFNPGGEEGPALCALKSGDKGGKMGLYSLQLPPLEEYQAPADSLVHGEQPEMLASAEPQAGPEAGTAALASADATLNKTERESEAAGHAATAGPDAPVADTKSGVSFSSGNFYYILNNILFDYNESTISPAAMRDVERIYVLMRKYPEIGIELTGHTDARGSQDYNLKLSNKRAQSVADYLITSGIEPGRITIKAAGESEAVAINQYEDGSDAPEGRRLNRHVSITINNLSSDKIRVADIFVPDELVPKEDKGYTVLLFQSTGRVAGIPEEFLEEQVSMISTDQSFMYTAGEFDRKTDAVAYLNEVIDQGYPDARIIERKSLENLIRDNSSSGPFHPESYTIQVMALKKPRDISYFKDLSRVHRYECRDGLCRFVTGEYERIEEAMRDLPVIRRKGYRDAMIMPCSRYVTMTAAE
jgi:outer membrane protein OmpA-like peptidoglycan-associated protein